MQKYIVTLSKAKLVSLSPRHSFATCLKEGLHGIKKRMESHSGLLPIIILH